MAFSYSHLLTLRTAPDLFPILSGMLRGAIAEVSFDRNGETVSRSHLLSEVSEFPKVLIAVEGSTSRPLGASILRVAAGGLRRRVVGAGK